MRSIRDSIWFFPILGGILILIGSLTPAASSGTVMYVWIWGLTSLELLLDGTRIIWLEKSVFIVGINIVILNIIFSIVLIITGYKYKLFRVNLKRISALWIFIGILILCSSILLIIWLDFHYFGGTFQNEMFVLFDPGFGVVGPVIGGILTLGTGYWVRTNLPNNYRKLKMPSRKSVPFLGAACPFCNRAVSVNAKFCNRCGNVLEAY
jgi:hypothetical protein